MTQTTAHELKGLLHQQGRLRVWSIIVTIMGDMVETMGGAISIAELIGLCTSLDIEPQAVRTAMSRLTKEGWVERIPDGRSTQYRLSDKRRGAFNDAARYIYAPPSDKPHAWRVGILPLWPHAQRQALVTKMAAVHPIIINQQMAVWSAAHDADLDDDCRAYLTIFNEMPSHIPNIVDADGQAQINPPPQASLINRLISHAEASKTDILTSEDALVIRIVLMHFWRRLVLRHVHVHAPFDHGQWPLPLFHQTMAAIYPSLAAQSAPALPYDVDMTITTARFRSG